MSTALETPSGKLDQSDPRVVVRGDQLSTVAILLGLTMVMLATLLGSSFTHGELLIELIIIGVSPR